MLFGFAELDAGLTVELARFLEAVAGDLGNVFDGDSYSSLRHNSRYYNGNWPASSPKQVNIQVKNK